MDSLVVTGEQIRAARALLRIDQKHLAAEAKLSLETIKRLEGMRGEIDANLKTLKSIRSAFSRLGAVFEFHDDVEQVVGVRSRSPAEPGAAQRVLTLQTPRTASLEPSRRDSEDQQGLHRLTYFSTATGAPDSDLTDEALARLAETCRRRNLHRRVTGAMLHCGRFFLQTLEGPITDVKEVYADIFEDSRHHALTIIQSKSVTQRVFLDDGMLFGTLSPIDEIIVDDLGMKEGFNPSKLTPAGALGLLVLVALSERRTSTADAGHRALSPARP